MTITQKTEDEVVIALHDNGLDISLTVGALMEGQLVCFNFNFYVLLFSYILTLV